MNDKEILKLLLSGEDREKKAICDLCKGIFERLHSCVYELRQAYLKAVAHNKNVTALGEKKDVFNQFLIPENTIDILHKRLDVLQAVLDGDGTNVIIKIKE